MNTPPKCLSEVRFAAILAYSTLRDPGTETSRQSQLVRDAIKSCRTNYLERFGERAAEAHGTVAELELFLGPETTLVPVPRSAPRVGDDALWPALRLCLELEKRGLCREVVVALERTTKIRKSAFLRRGEDRPSPEEHVSTMAVDRAVATLLTHRILIVDDVVTRGSQLLAAASLVASAFPAAEVRALAALRAVSGEEVEAIYEPVVGTITNAGNNQVWRRP